MFIYILVLVLNSRNNNEILVSAFKSADKCIEAQVELEYKHKARSHTTRCLKTKVE